MMRHGANTYALHIETHPNMQHMVPQLRDVEFDTMLEGDLDALQGSNRAGCISASV